MKIDPLDPHYQAVSAANKPNDSGFWQYKVYADRGVSWRRGVKRQWGCPKRQFSVVSLAISPEAL